MHGVLLRLRFSIAAAAAKGTASGGARIAVEAYGREHCDYWRLLVTMKQVHGLVHGRASPATADGAAAAGLCLVCSKEHRSMVQHALVSALRFDADARTLCLLCSGAGVDMRVGADARTTQKFATEVDEGISLRAPQPRPPSQLTVTQPASGTLAGFVRRRYCQVLKVRVGPWEEAASLLTGAIVTIYAKSNAGARGNNLSQVKQAGSATDRALRIVVYDPRRARIAEACITGEKDLRESQPMSCHQTEAEAEVPGGAPALKCLAYDPDHREIKLQLRQNWSEKPWLAAYNELDAQDTLPDPLNTTRGQPEMFAPGESTNGFGAPVLQRVIGLNGLRVLLTAYCADTCATSTLHTSGTELIRQVGNKPHLLTGALLEDTVAQLFNTTRFRRQAPLFNSQREAKILYDAQIKDWTTVTPNTILMDDDTDEVFGVVLRVAEFTELLAKHAPTIAATGEGKDCCRTNHAKGRSKRSGGMYGADGVRVCNGKLGPYAGDPEHTAKLMACRRELLGALWEHIGLVMEDDCDKFRKSAGPAAAAALGVTDKDPYINGQITKNFAAAEHIDKDSNDPQIATDVYMTDKTASVRRLDFAQRGCADAAIRGRTGDGRTTAAAPASAPSARVQSEHVHMWFSIAHWTTVHHKDCKYPGCITGGSFFWSEYCAYVDISNVGDGVIVAWKSSAVMHGTTHCMMPQDHGCTRLANSYQNQMRAVEHIIKGGQVPVLHGRQGGICGPRLSALDSCSAAIPNPPVPAPLHSGSSAQQRRGRKRDISPAATPPHAAAAATKRACRHSSRTEESQRQSRGTEPQCAAATPGKPLRVKIPRLPDASNAVDSDCGAVQRQQTGAGKKRSGLQISGTAAPAPHGRADLMASLKAGRELWCYWNKPTLAKGWYHAKILDVNGDGITEGALCVARVIYPPLGLDDKAKIHKHTLHPHQHQECTQAAEVPHESWLVTGQQAVAKLSGVAEVSSEAGGSRRMTRRQVAEHTVVRHDDD
ncbi:hypothetical protein JKP88DRAFT_262717 [Tribonema minus]|uniref:Uncharacterized protein n=1 Tax=Tribonema minus TaxID=303371 RepID=A0A835Z1L5_9STRA|nr:hypothetical protein JKP88DRAFT_262717 [Tribonema minus]